MKNNKGFTLIELLVTIAIVGALFVSAGFGLSNVLKNSRKKQSSSYLKEVMESADTYIAIKKLEYTEEEKSIDITILIKKGLLGESITKEKNPLTCENFKMIQKKANGTTTPGTQVYYKMVDYELKIYMKDSNNVFCFLNSIDSCKIKDC